MGKTLVHRVIFYDLLSNPSELQDSKKPTVEPHLSIPLVPGLEAVWAPNGYGKTFAMKILSRLRFPQPYSESRLLMRSKYWLGQFLEESYREVIEPTESTLTREEFLRRDPMGADWSGIANWRDSSEHRMVPFSRMMIRFVTIDDNEEIENVEDLWISMRDWLEDEERTKWHWMDDEGEEAPCHLLLVDSTNSPYEPNFDSELRSMIPGIGAPTHDPTRDIPTTEIDSEEDSNFIGPTFPFFPRVDPLGRDYNFSSFMIDPSHPEEGWEGGRIHQLLEILRKTRVSYIEIPRECHAPGKDPLESCQKLLSSMIDSEFERVAIERMTEGEIDSEKVMFTHIQHIFEKINQTIMTDSKDPWARKIVSISDRNPIAVREIPMKFERPWNNDRVDPTTLSFGQRSAILLECWLGYLEYIEGLKDSMGEEIRFCLVIDEPESGRSEYSVRMMTERILESSQIIGLDSSNSLVVLSHRSDVLSAVGDGNRYHVMQPFDVGLEYRGEKE